MQFSAMETLMVALLVLGAGQWIVHKVTLLSRLNMPESLVGGLLATIVVTLMHVSGISLPGEAGCASIPSQIIFIRATASVGPVLLQRRVVP